LALDHFALLSNTHSNDTWLVEFVESAKVSLINAGAPTRHLFLSHIVFCKCQVSVFFQDDNSSDGYQCGLLDLPNWAYSYALAVYRINENQPSPDSEAKANNAIKTALSRFPSIVEHLLAKNEVDLTGRSFQTDWPSVLGYVSDR
jgi:hypothetical protein